MGLNLAVQRAIEKDYRDGVTSKEIREKYSITDCSPLETQIPTLWTYQHDRRKALGQLVIVPKKEVVEKVELNVTTVDKTLSPQKRAWITIRANKKRKEEEANTTKDNKPSDYAIYIGDGESIYNKVPNISVYKELDKASVLCYINKIEAILSELKKIVEDVQ